jgi:hypothetical protein
LLFVDFGCLVFDALRLEIFDRSHDVGKDRAYPPVQNRL